MTSATLSRAAARIVHVCLEPRPEAVTLAAAPLIDRGRLAVVLQAAGLLSALERAGWRVRDWSAARASADGRLTVAGAEPGRERPAQEVLRELLDRLFATEAGRLTGKGGARQAARSLLDGWRQSLVPLAPDDAVAQVLDAAPFLWEPAYDAAREALAAELTTEAGARVWVAGPPPFRRRLLATPEPARGLAAARGRLAGSAARALWEGLEEGDPCELTAARRWRAAVAAWARHPPRTEEDRTALARALAALGRFETALAALSGLPSTAAAILRAECQALLGQLGAARAALAGVPRDRLAPEEAVAFAEIASRVLANRGKAEGPAEIAGLAGCGESLRVRGLLVAAWTAWDRGAPAEMAKALEAARPAALGSADPDLAWRWHHARALLAIEDGDGTAATEHAARALRLGRRHLPRHRAAGLWNDLGLARALAGDLAGAERAFRASHRLFLGCDGPRKTTLALSNLAEIRLRRGRLDGVREILERSAAENRAAGNLRGLTQDRELQARWELAAGRSEAALALCREAAAGLDRQGVDWRRPELRLLTARALGWLGRTGEAAAALDDLPAAVLLALEPEERPAVFALAGRIEDARAAAATLPDPALRDLWTALLDGLDCRAAPAALWSAALAPLEPYRAARLVHDAERAAPGAAPPDILRRAAADLRAAGAAPLAALLEARDHGPWQALTAYCAARPGDPAALAALFAGIGCPPLPAGTVATDTADTETPALRALRALADRDRAAPRVLAAGREREPEPAPRTWEERRAAAGMVGESPALRAAMERLDRLAAGSLPLLILGESGTGKELAARRVHRASPRSRAPFLAVNCAALSETLILSDLFGHARGAFTGADRDRAGVFQAAEGGTVFLDEIGDLPLQAQAMLLRVLQEGEVRRLGESEPRRIDVRVVAATHRDLAAMVEAKTFRQDLYYRLKGGTIELPPLRERGKDVLLLADSFLARMDMDMPPSARLSNAARARLLAYPWPGNVRELENVLRVAAALAGGDPIQPEHLELPGVESPSATFYHREVDALRRRLIESALVACDGNLTEAARRLGMSRQGLSYLRRQLGIA